MSNNPDTINVVIAGLGGQGIVKASDILADSAFRAGYDVKKSEVHGMSQRGGSVTSDVRFGPKVSSPMVPQGEAAFLVVTDDTQIAPNLHHLHPDGVLIGLDSVPHLIEAGEDDVMLRRVVNIALLGVLSVYLDIAENHWLDAVRANLPPRTHNLNIRVFRMSRWMETVMRKVTGDDNHKDLRQS